MVDRLTIVQLAERCSAEAKRYKQTQQSNEEYCLELFRRALTEQNETAWEAIYSQYQLLVQHWIYQYSRFHETGEEADLFVNDAFARMWQYGSKHTFNSLKECLSFLRTCVWSAIENVMRKQKKDALMDSIPWDTIISSISINLEDTAEFSILWTDIKEALMETIQNEQERLVAEESWIYGLAPRTVRERYPNVFATVDEVNQSKRNIIRRLQRHPKVKKWNKK